MKRRFEFPNTNVNLHFVKIANSESAIQIKGQTTSDFLKWKKQANDFEKLSLCYFWNLLFCIVDFYSDYMFMPESAPIYLAFFCHYHLLISCKFVTYVTKEISKNNKSPLIFLGVASFTH